MCMAVYGLGLFRAGVQIVAVFVLFQGLAEALTQG